MFILISINLTKYVKFNKKQVFYPIKLRFVEYIIMFEFAIEVDSD